MPWKETSAMKERMKFIVAVDASEEDFGSICRAFGISRTTGYKWVGRFENEQLAGLQDRPRVRKTQSHATPPEVVGALLALRKRHPTWGPRKLRQYLIDHPKELDALALLDLPAASTIGDILKRFGLVRPRRRRLRVPVHPGPLTEPGWCNDVWTTDFKGQRRLGNGTLCYPLTVCDLYSRYLLKSEGLLGTSAKPVLEQFEMLFRDVGLPRCIRSDNGGPFASNAAGGLSELSLWWVKLGITPERTKKGSPQENGAHERMHRTLEAEAFKPPQADMLLQQLVFDAFRAVFNDERPHEAIAMRTPGSIYVPSVREYRGQERSPEYDEDVEVRTTNRNGVVKWRGLQFTIGTLFGGEPLGFVERGEDAWQLYFGPILLADVTKRGKELRVERHPKPEARQEPSRPEEQAEEQTEEQAEEQA